MVISSVTIKYLKINNEGGNAQIKIAKVFIRSVIYKT